MGEKPPILIYHLVYIGRSLPQWLMGITLFARYILGLEILLPTGCVRLGN